MLAALARSHEDFLTYAGDQLGESVFASAEHAELYRKIAEAHTESGTPPSLEEVEPPDDLPTFLQRLAELRRCRTAVALVTNFLADLAPITGKQGRSKHSCDVAMQLE